MCEFELHTMDKDRRGSDKAECREGQERKRALEFNQQSPVHMFGVQPVDSGNQGSKIHCPIKVFGWRYRLCMLGF